MKQRGYNKMTVGNLIERLAKLPQNTNIQIFCSNDNYSGEYLNFTEDSIFIDEDGNLCFDGSAEY